MFKKTHLALLLLAAAVLLVLNLDKPAKKINQPKPNYVPLDQSVSEYLVAQEGTYGLYFIDLKSGEKFGYNQYTSFHAASTFKLPMNLYLYTQAEKEKINLAQKLTYQSRHAEGGTGILKNYPPGKSYTIKQLATYSIVNSDNIATNILLERLDRKKVKSYMRDLGGKVVEDDNNVTCPHDLALYMQKTIEFYRTGSPEAKMLTENLFAAEFKDRIPAAVPPGVKVANKIGNWPPTGTYNDVAYVEHPVRPYILAVTCSGTPGYGSAVPVIRQVSKMIYEYQATENSP
ncbi:beta-lactamase class A [Desulfotomaculum arcticum]|uniref:Beta-lactamase class A n=1 Tax=Desulfotruncus arcticus DSM 17038 TaxID=1121424 RepID=A0A1I2ZK77_9FIRM|nr:serine hydrolase [Desulfotruncus arcticus]SFH38134.1 beta-lactamase class A [Desulfotomaculum arcticum] [Desulfotruncus arcticus DSM 17038]